MYKNKTHSIILIALLGVIGLILSLIKIPVPFLPPFLSLDLAYIPIFMSLIILGYKNSLATAFIKNLLHFILISHEPVGSIANMVVEIIFLSILFYFYKKSTKQIIFGGLIATFAMTMVMAILNYFVLLPMYGFIIDLADITNNLKALVTYGIIPFNIIKGIFLIILFFITKKIIKQIPNTLRTNR